MYVDRVLTQDEIDALYNNGNGDTVCVDVGCVAEPFATSTNDTTNLEIGGLFLVFMVMLEIVASQFRLKKRGHN